MANVELRPGDTLEIIWTSLQETPLGSKEVESSFAFSYEELLSKLKSKGRAGKSRRVGSDGARFSRVFALATNALRKGKWSTGADIDREEVFTKLVARFKKLEVEEYGNITGNAKQSLLHLYQGDSVLNPDQLAIVKKIVDAVGPVVEK